MKKCNLISKDICMIHVPLCRQGTAYTCGVAAVQSVLGYYCIDYRQDILEENLKSNPQRGTKVEEIIKFAESINATGELLLNLKIDCIKEYLSLNLPVILMIQAWGEKESYEQTWEDGHYVVACGYDKYNIICMDPSILGNYTYISNEKLLSCWHDQSDGIKYEKAGIIIVPTDFSCLYNPNELKTLN
ncbi:C39 family peptidase [Anaeromicropila populeti]|uniref:Peptidase_C39 like family protein n=1 Tax=Anaeromicropila populeti TaxID=37658 RepID=A0A1I6IL04_9FIRM|nr:C39 family peptidase [Anaeromicropila populeti]SFR67406.1 Peptidase_C39 like family protein [Anaeromicropila populeti]